MYLELDLMFKFYSTFQTDVLTDHARASPSVSLNSDVLPAKEAGIC